MEVNKIYGLKVALIDEEVSCDSLNLKNARLFYTSNNYSLPLLKDVVEGFEEALKKETNVEEDKEASLKKGGIEFLLKSVKTSNPSYKKIGERIGEYLYDIRELSEEGMKREGVRKIDYEPYISLEHMCIKIENLKEEYQNENLRTTIKYSEMRKEPDIEDMIDILPGSYNKVSGKNAKAYRISKEQMKLLKKNVISPFKNELKKATGYSRDNVPDDTEINIFDIGNYVFMVQTSPREEIKYGEAAKSFIKIVEEPKDLCKRRDDKLYLPVNVLYEKYNKLVEDNTRTIVQQDIMTMPKPTYDHVVIRTG